MHFERAGLFALLAKELRPSRVLYPGCSIHITPSFSFQHVVYVDKSDLAVNFFSQTKEVSKFIDVNKTYKTTSYWKFVNSDYKEELPFELGYFDLIISLFSGEHLKFTDKYLSKNGIVLSTSTFSDAHYLEHHNKYEIINNIRCKSVNYEFIKSKNYMAPKRSDLIEDKGALRYRDNNVYSLFMKKY
jgi:hypothetical protein